ncbi:unnamed protein product [Thlaspi arvense]|uniref:Uncharacterized protein n=1 Tax=Thlaspi arvense TaxID=13288 RepID=A0AAU9SPV3_THLAR|nr:unnamed protein product [Thlaspi arvense]
MVAVPVILVSCAAAIISSFVFHDHHRRKKQVIQTKSVEFMPFYLSFFSFLASWIWLAYGLLIVIFSSRFSPNMVGCPLGVLQLLLYCKYRKKGVMEEEHKSWDVEKNNGEKTKQRFQLVVAEDSSTTGARVEQVFS